ncbi:MAG: prenyltransferase/squalene oxidase repeat-containing protein [Actinomycetota bacterium]
MGLKAKGVVSKASPAKTIMLLIFLSSFITFSIFIANGGSAANASGDDVPAMIDRARQFVESQQNEDGSWGSRLAMGDTALCAEGLLWQGGDADALNSALAWLTSSTAANSDFISRKACCIALAGDPATPSQVERDFLAACGHEDGSLSLAPGERGNPLDTAISYPALLSLQEMDKAEAAITYLISSQLEDGGFSSGR